MILLMIHYDNINNNRAILIQKWSILKLNPCFIFVYLYNFENYGSWTVYQKSKSKQVNSLAVFYS